MTVTSTQSPSIGERRVAYLSLLLLFFRIFKALLDPEDQVAQRVALAPLITSTSRTFSKVSKPKYLVVFRFTLRARCPEQDVRRVNQNDAEIGNGHFAPRIPLQQNLDSQIYETA